MGCNLDGEISLSGSGSINRNVSSGTFSPLDIPVSETLGGQTIWDLSRHKRSSSWDLWFRVYTHALFLESRIFPKMELRAKPLDYIPFGFADIWKGNYHGEPVCIKAVRRNSPVFEGSKAYVKSIRSYFFDQGSTKDAPHMTFRRESKPISHPNVLPIIDVSETLFPFCIMSPWMSNGNIAQYTQTNPGANRLTLVCAHQLEAR